MDTPVKLTFAVSNPAYSTTDEYLITSDTYPERNLGDEFFKFREHDRVEVSLETQDPAAFLQIEAYDREKPVELKPGDPAIVISPGGDMDEMVTPGYHDIILYTSKGRYAGFYKVEPSSLSWSGLMNIRKTLEKVTAGLAYNLYLKKMSRQDRYSTTQSNLYALYEYIKSEEDSLLNHVRKVVNDPITQLSKPYREQSISRRPDAKSIRWQAKKGFIQNANPYAPEVVFENHAEPDLDTLENLWVKKIIQVTVNTLSYLEENYLAILNRLQAEYEEKERQIQQKQREYSRVRMNPKVDADYKRKLTDRISGLMREMNELSERMGFIQSIVQDVKRMKGTLVHFEHDTWLSELKGAERVRKPTRRLFQGHRTSYIYRFYKDLVVRQKGRESEYISFPHKKTSKLFEYYTVIMIAHILQSIGLEWTHGWIADSDNPTAFNGELPPESHLIFENNNYRVTLDYDKEYFDEPDDPHTPQFVSNYAKHRRPDILVAAFDRKTGALCRAMIVEVKCCKTRNIQIDGGADTEAISQIKQYAGYGYSDTQHIHRGIIDRVVLVYPKQDHLIRNYYFLYKFSFIPIQPNEVLEETEGYQELKQELLEILPEDIQTEEETA